VDYKEIEFFDVDSEKREILIAYLSGIGYDTFEEKSDCLKAYIPENAFDAKALIEEVTDRFQSLSYCIGTVARQNWNAVWEKNFEPMQVGDVFIRAPFHESRAGVKHELVIEPKMSFGTGHHATTSLMVQEMQRTDFNGKTVLDMGCGTSLLAILASKLGANSVLAIDIDDWAVENSIENCARNGVSNIGVLKGDVILLKDRFFDLMLANINRNVLLADMHAYASSLNPGGEILFSGFYQSDEETIRSCAESFGLHFLNSSGMNQWSLMRFSKI
jgi:ribosomal protein L11 methyltransferase